MNSTVSIIVPVFNAEATLDRCIESLLRQEYRLTEIILVDDGSFDNSPVMCDQYARRHPSISVVHQTNSGLSGARNTGILAATGDYCLFVDSDDYIDEGMAGDLVRVARASDAEVVISNLLYESGFRTQMGTMPWEEDVGFRGIAVLHDLLPHYVSGVDCGGEPHTQIFGSVCRCLFDLRFLRNNNVYFDSGALYGEDREFMIRLLPLCTSVYVTSRCYYHYDRGVDGGTSTQRYRPGLYRAVKYRQSCHARSLDSAGLLDDVALPLTFSWLCDIMGVIDNLSLPGGPGLGRAISEAREALGDGGFLAGLSNMGQRQLDMLGRRRLWLIMHQLTLYLVASRFRAAVRRVALAIRRRLR